MKEKQGVREVINELESIFSLVNNVSEDAATKLMDTIRKLERIKDDVGITPDDILQLLKKNPQHFLVELMKAVGPEGVFKAMSNVMGLRDEDLTIFSKTIPPLDSYSIERLKVLESELKLQNDSLSKFLVKTIQDHISRREGKT